MQAAVKPIMGLWPLAAAFLLLSLCGCSCTSETPTKRMASESHWARISIRLSRMMEKRAVVKIFSCETTYNTLATAIEV